MRPAHIHFYVQAHGYKPLITQIYDKDCEHVAKDTVFAVKDSLVVEFQEVGPKKTELKVHPFMLQLGFTTYIMIDAV